VGLRVGEEAAHLGAGARRVHVGQHHRVEAGVPEPLERVGAGRGAHEVVVETAPGGGAPLPVAVVERADRLPHPFPPGRAHGTSYASFFLPMRYRSNQATMCWSLSTRCHGLPERLSSWLSSGKRTMTVGFFRYLSARNICSPPSAGGVL